MKKPCLLLDMSRGNGVNRLEETEMKPGGVGGLGEEDQTFKNFQGQSIGDKEQEEGITIQNQVLR